jgi:hypothetical protein
LFTPNVGSHYQQIQQINYFISFDNIDQSGGQVAAGAICFSAALTARACERECSRSHARLGHFVRVGQVDQVCAAQAYMLISMPTGSSTIFGAFQDIFCSL